MALTKLSGTIEAWKEARLDCTENELLAINDAVIALERLDGMFDTRNVLSIVQAAKDELSMQVTNREKELERWRGTGVKKGMASDA